MDSHSRWSFCGVILLQCLYFSHSSILEFRRGHTIMDSPRASSDLTPLMTASLRNCRRIIWTKYQTRVVFKKQLYWNEQLTTLFAVQEVLFYFFVIHFGIMMQHHWSNCIQVNWSFTLHRLRGCFSKFFAFCIGWVKLHASFWNHNENIFKKYRHSPYKTTLRLQSNISITNVRSIIQILATLQFTSNVSKSC